MSTSVSSSLQSVATSLRAVIADLDLFASTGVEPLILVEHVRELSLAVAYARLAHTPCGAAVQQVDEWTIEASDPSPDLDGPHRRDQLASDLWTLVGLVNDLSVSSRQTPSIDTLRLLADRIDEQVAEAKIDAIWMQHGPPSWDRGTGVLDYAEQPIEFGKQATLMRRVLDSFETDGWSGEPFVAEHEEEAADAVKRLNARTDPMGPIFSRKGKRVYAKPIA